jgi:hypothetical protein
LQAPEPCLQHTGEAPFVPAPTAFLTAPLDREEPQGRKEPPRPPSGPVRIPAPGAGAQPYGKVLTLYLFLYLFFLFFLFSFYLFIFIRIILMLLVLSLYLFSNCGKEQNK